MYDDIVYLYVAGHDAGEFVVNVMDRGPDPLLIVHAYSGSFVQSASKLVQSCFLQRRHIQKIRCNLLQFFNYLFTL